MNTIYKLLLVFTVFIFSSISYSQNADPSIVMLMNPATVILGGEGTLHATVGNNGNNTIVANSLRVTISVGSDAEIIGIASGSDSRWTQLTLTTGSGNTIRLKNTAGGFTSSDLGEILLTVRGITQSGPDFILGNIVYITASNLLLCGVCPPIPLNITQGNTSVENDNSMVSLAVTVAVPAIIAVTDTPSVLPGTKTPSVIINDTVNGLPAVIGTAPGDITLTSTPNGPLTVNPDGTISVTSNTPAGTYPISYTICEVNNPTNCSTVTTTVSVTAPAIIAVTDTPSVLPGTKTPSVITNDTVNGSTGLTIGTAPGDITLTSTPNGPLTMNPDGTISVTSNTPAGTYPISYTICEVNNPTNCSTVTTTVSVTAPAIIAVTDTPSVLPGTKTPSVITNDTVNGLPAVIGIAPGDITLTSTPNGPLTVNPDGTISVTSNTPAGTYPISYTICEVNNPTNCSTVTTTVSVTAPAIIAVTDTPSVLPGTKTPSVITNDTVNGSTGLTIGTAPGDITLTSTPNGPLTMNPDGTISVTSNTPAGTYPISYTICEVNNPTNCSTVTTTVTVTAPAIIAVTDTPSVLPGTKTPSVITNDTVNGLPAVIGTAPGDITLTSTPNGPLTMNPDGTISVTANTPAGTYPISYTICEVNNPTNCSTVTTTVSVTAPAIIAVTDTPSVLPGTKTPSVIINDTVNGLPAVIGTAPGDITLTSTPNGPLTVNPDGTISVTSNTPAGTYPISYTICEVNNPANCSTVTTTVSVTAPAIIAVTDTPSVLPGTKTPSVIINDTVNGLPAVIGTAPGDITLTSTPNGPLTMNPDGTISVTSNTPAGTYPISYTICEVNNPTNCSTVTTTVSVTAPAIIAVTDTPSVLPGTKTPSVIINDTVNGLPAVIGTAPGDITLTSTPNGPLMVNPDGTITVAANSPAGTYPISYTICEVNNPANCSTVTTTVSVTAPAIIAVTDTPSVLPGTKTPSVIINDTVNGLPAVIGIAPGDITLTSTPNGPLTVNPDGTISVTSNTPAGTYPISYTICEVNNPTNCSTVTTTVSVTAPAIIAVTDTPSVLPGTKTPSVIINDTVNGLPAVIGIAPGDITLTSTPNGPLTMNPDGTISVTSNTPAGTYPISYTICEVNNPTNCSTVTTTVSVTAPAIIAVTDTPSVLPGTKTPSVIINDTVNGLPAVIGTAPGDITLTSTPNGPLTVNPDGTISVTSNTPAGTYPISYTICEVNNPANCSTVTTTVSVTAPAIIAVTDTPSVLPGTKTPSVIINDTVNGLPAVIGTAPGDITLTSTPNGPLTMNPDGTISVTSNTPAGTYPISYTICEVNNPTNCSTVTTTVSVTAPAIIAVTDTPSVLPGTKTPSVIINDTVNGLPAVIGIAPGDITLTSTPNGPLTMNPDGTISVTANTPAGTYPISYTICEVNNPTNCSTVTTTVSVTAPAIIAVTDTPSVLPGTKTPSVIINDTVNGLPAVIGTAPGDITLTSTPNGPLTMNPDGTISVTSNTPAGTYPISYTICEVNNPANCSTVTVFVTVLEKPSIAIIMAAHFNDDHKDGFAVIGETISYSFTVTNTGNVALTNVTITDPLTGIVLSGGPISLGIGQANSIAFSGIYSLTKDDLLLGMVTNQATAFGTSPLNNIVKDLSDSNSSLNNNPTVIPIDGCDIEVFNAVSPNGDGQNDVFYIRGLECYSDNTVEIYNRWGVLVFERSGYNNSDRAFKGISEGRVTVNKSEELPVGTYFYILKYKDKASNAFQKAGYLYLNR